MQGSLSLPQRLSLQSIVAILSYRRFTLRSAGICRVPRWQASEVYKPAKRNSSVQRIHQGTNLGQEKHSRLEGPGLSWGSASGGGEGNRRMRGCSIATTSSCPSRTDVTPVASNPAVSVSGKVCSVFQKSTFGILRPVHRNTALQRLSLQSQRYARKPFVRVAGNKGGPDLLLKEDGAEFKRIVSKDDSVTIFYDSNISSESEDDDVVEGIDGRANTRPKMKAAKEDAEHSDSGSDDYEEKGKDHKKSNELKALGKTEYSKSGKEGLGKDEEDSGTESDDEEEEQKELQSTEMTSRKGERVGKLEDSDKDSEDEEKKLAKEEKKKAKAELKNSLKTLKKEEKKQKKEATLTASQKEDVNDRDEDGNKKKRSSKDKKMLTAVQNDGVESDSDSEHDEDSKVQTNSQVKLNVNEELASDSESEDEDDGVTDLVAEILEKDEEEFDIIEDEVTANEIENELEQQIDDLDDEDDGFWDEDEEGDVVAGDGGYGGGVVLGGTEWGKRALDLAQQVVTESGSDFSLFAFIASPDGVIKARLDKLSDKYGSPTMIDIEQFSKKFINALEEAGEAGTLPKDVDVEVSSPGAERVVRVPEDLERFKELPMYVQYLEGDKGLGKGDQDLTEKEGVLELESLDIAAGISVWKTANVKINREVKGKGRPLNSKQKKWRAELPLATLKQVRLYVDV